MYMKSYADAYRCWSGHPLFLFLNVIFCPIFFIAVTLLCTALKTNTKCLKLLYVICLIHAGLAYIEVFCQIKLIGLCLYIYATVMRLRCNAVIHCQKSSITNAFKACNISTDFNFYIVRQINYTNNYVKIDRHIIRVSGVIA